MISINSQVISLVENALHEDLENLGDCTSKFILTPEATCNAKLIARQEGVLAGLNIFEYVFKKCHADILIEYHFQDGETTQNEDLICSISGNAISILTAERTALNFLQRLSGIATLTSSFVEKVGGTKAKILDTRKTTPGYRKLEKYAVKMGGGQNHRMGLYDMILIKDNHIAAAGSISNAVTLAVQSMKVEKLELKIEVEVTNLSQLKEAVDLPIQRVMLDNMSLKDIQMAVEFVNGRLETEISGGVTLETVRGFAETGVDFISVGALTHSAQAMDFSLLVN